MWFQAGLIFIEIEVFWSNQTNSVNMMRNHLFPHVVKHTENIVISPISWPPKSGCIFYSNLFEQLKIRSEFVFQGLNIKQLPSYVRGPDS